MSFKLSNKDILISMFRHVGDQYSVDKVRERLGNATLGTVRVWLSQIRKSTGISLRIRRGMIVRDA